MSTGRVAGTRAAALLLLLALLLSSMGAALLAPPAVLASEDPTADPSPTPAATDSVTFGVLGDWSSDKPNYPISVAELKRLVARNGTFVLAVGDLGYQPGDEANWCAKLKAVVNQTEVVAGNHDDGTNTGGMIGNYVKYCPFNMDADLVAGPTYGYGISYYFDIPRVNPLARIIMITPGQTGAPEQGENYNPGGAEYNWVLNAVADARSKGIPWVFAGMHRLCINAGSYGCEIGQAFWDALITAGVDVLFTGHYHVYERSYQLNHGPGCTTVSGSSYNAACVVSFNTTVMTKGAGIVQVTDGAGGTSLYAIDRSNDGQYFPVYMGSNMNSQNKSNGWSPSIITLNATTLKGTTAFCPGSTFGTDGECPSQAPGTFQDSFTISSGAPPPPPPPPPLSVDFTFSPSHPITGQTITFAGSASGGTPPYAYTWTFGDGATGSGANVTHSYSQAGDYSVRLTATDSSSQTASATKTVTVSAPPVPTADFTYNPASPVAGDTVSFSGSASGGTAPYSFAWDFGDGSTASGANTSHIFGQAGNYTVVLTVTDAATQTDTATKTVAVTAPPPPPPPGSPTASFGFTPAWPIVGATVTLDASASSDPNGRPLEFRWDWTDDGTFDTSWSSAPTTTHAYSAAGTVNTKLQVRNDLGFMDNVTHAIPVDGSPPVTTASISGTSGNHGWYRSAATATLTATDDVSGVAATWARSDGGSWSQVTTITFTSDGIHSLDYYSVDRAGQVESTHSVSVSIDTVPPATTASLSGTQETNGSYRVSVNVSLTAADASSGVDGISYRIDSGSWQAYVSTFLVTGAGAHQVRFRSTDGAGNVEGTKSVSFTIDVPSPPPPSGPPVSTLTLTGQTGADSWYTSPVIVTLNATSPSSASLTIAYRLDDGTWTTYTNPFTVADGLHTLAYNATDEFGAAEATRTASFKVDTTPPRTVATLTGTPGRDHWYIAPVSVELDAADTTSGVARTEYRLDGGAWQTYAAGLMIGNGRHTFDFRSADAAGLVEAISSRSIKVDGSPPRLTAPPSGGIQTISTFAFVWGAVDDVAGVVDNEVSVDGMPFTSLGLNTTTSLTLADGSHTITLRVTDDASNRAWANVTLRVDTNVFSPTGPLQGMPTYVVLVVVLGTLIFLAAHRRARAARARRQRALARMRVRG